MLARGPMTVSAAARVRTHMRTPIGTHMRTPIGTHIRLAVMLAPGRMRVYQTHSASSCPCVRARVSA